MNPVGFEAYRRLVQLPAKQPAKNCSNGAKLSPLLESFELWSGKPRKLYNPQPAEQLLSDCNLRLSSNPFARVLAAPIRVETMDRTRVPRSLLLRTHVVEREMEDGKPLALTSVPVASRYGPSSYILNCSMVPTWRKATRFLGPVHESSLLNGIHNLTLVDVDMKRIFGEYENELSKRLGLLMKEHISVSRSDSNVILTNDLSEQYRIQVEGPYSTKMIFFNISKLNSTFKQVILPYFSPTITEILLSRNKDDELIEILYRALCLG